MGEVVGLKETKEGSRVRLVFESGRDFAFRPEELLRVVAGYETGLASRGRRSHAQAPLCTPSAIVHTG